MNERYDLSAQEQIPLDTGVKVADSQNSKERPVNTIIHRTPGNAPHQKLR